ncbi:decaprenylphospho-beta-D-ribofuranose 2-oxidase [Rhodobacter aestuarii]|uniref:Decaprenylphospho-beta-D-ribofuranose 2-oxidase n=1 Tax=Rhodobacter aestuarii TaxID=453582 RepID=A0A1N7K2Q7_9RHOB|nr:FAD-binding oxidoreductase [Rhodobacter aestuarii]PTV95883.1 decaprenylphospho-beta-D-ribofuranose 2-oxidase [Rhodobacter aestuarii]SIS55882.1 decaprenylphospho-beta-D-ribofuranose 2-oxidase [Rhodobacter aestuarii]
MTKDTHYTGWGRALRAKGPVARPEKLRHLAELPPTPAFGMRRSYGDAPLNSGGAMVDMSGFDRFLAFDPETGCLTVEAGARIGDVATAFVPQGWIPAVMPGTGFATVGGCIAQDVHGKNHHHVGSFGAHVTEIVLLQNGVELTATPGTALFQATVGGLGQTGVILRATLRLKRCDGNLMLVTERRARNWEEHLAFLDASEASYTVGWIDATATGPAMGRGIVEEGEIGKGLVKERKRTAKVPLDAPHFALSSPVVRAFNQAYYHRVPAHGRTIARPMADFFFPLDKIHDWNRLYGRRGFHQFQCVVPLSSARALRAMMERISTSGLASPLAVLKRMGAGRAGYLSFPMEGYTLAIDFPNRAAARDLIRTLEIETAEAGGRLYFAKDALAEGARIRTMYPELNLWQEEVARADPTGAYQTDLVRRLNLRSA